MLFVVLTAIYLFTWLCFNYSLRFDIWMNVIKISKFIFFIVFKKIFNKGNRKHFPRVPIDQLRNLVTAPSHNMKTRLIMQNAKFYFLLCSKVKEWGAKFYGSFLSFYQVFSRYFFSLVKSIIILVISIDIFSSTDGAGRWKYHGEHWSKLR
jgi:hypothetical protein